MKRAESAFLFCLPLLAAGPFVPVNEAGFKNRWTHTKAAKWCYTIFWATQCSLPRAVSATGAAERKLRAQGLEVVTISADDREHQAAAGKFIQMFDVPGAVYLKQADDDDRFSSAIDAKWKWGSARAFPVRQVRPQGPFVHWRSAGYGVAGAIRKLL